MKRRSDSLELQHIEINTFSSASTVQLVKTKAINQSFEQCDSLLMLPYSCHATRKPAQLKKEENLVKRHGTIAKTSEGKEILNFGT